MCEKLNKVMFRVLPMRLDRLISRWFVIGFHAAPQVNSWLSAVFGDQPVPQFEVNTRTVDLLHQLAQSSEARCSETALLTEDLRQKAAEYEAEGECGAVLYIICVGRILSNGQI